MNLQLRVFNLLGILFIIQGCNIYQSSGRKSFEGKIPDSNHIQSFAESGHARHSTGFYQAKISKFANGSFQIILTEKGAP